MTQRERLWINKAVEKQNVGVTRNKAETVEETKTYFDRFLVTFLNGYLQTCPSYTYIKYIMVVNAVYVLL